MGWIDATRLQRGRTAASTAKLPDLLRKSLYHPRCNFRWQGNHRRPANVASRSAIRHPCTTCNDLQPPLERRRGRQLTKQT